ncbi:MAG: ComEC/Rec2 family competence protein [Bacillota bacterium]|jgi:competence protein ComEC|nr:ComEC/Rec2 family competence protein [Bacillota bacterium]
MKKLYLLILLATIFLFTGCSYIEHTKGADSKTNHIENEELYEDNNSNIDRIEEKDIETHKIKDDLQTNNQTTTSDIESILKIHIIDVGQGNCVLIQSNDQYMLIDAGDWDKGNLVVEYLKSLGIVKLDYLLATHPHSDHIGGMADVINNFQLDKLIMPNVIHTSKTFENLLDTISDNNLRITKPIVGTEYSLGSDQFVIIAPNRSDYDNLNNYSIGIKLTNGDKAFIFTGDAEIESEDEMLENDIDLDADVLLLGHHGSSTSNGERFLDAVSPDIAIISVGEDNQYGHPHDEVLQSVKDRDIKLYRTDKQGTIILVSDGKSISVDKEPYEITDKQELTEKETSLVETNKDEPVHITKTGARYHRSNCRHLKSNIVVSLQEAVDKGLTPCKTCKPPDLIVKGD